MVSVNVGLTRLRNNIGIRKIKSPAYGRAFNYQLFNFYG
jgi:hypothetical protein